MSKVDLTIHRCRRCDDLAARLDEAEETIRQMQEAMGSNWPCPPEFRLTPQQEAILACLLRHGRTTREGLAVAAAGDLRRIPVSVDTVSVQLSKLRKALKPWGLHIDTIYGFGAFELRPLSRAALRRWKSPPLWLADPWLPEWRRMCEVAA